MEQKDIQFDLIFFVDYRALAEGDFSFFDNIDYERAKVRILTPEISAFNDHYKSISDAAAKQNFKKTRVDFLNRLITENKLKSLGGENEQKTEYHLLEILVKKYYLQNVLIVSNNAQKAELFLPLVPVFEAFGHTLKVVSLTDSVTEYEFKGRGDALAKLSARQETTCEKQKPAGEQPRAEEQVSTEEQPSAEEQPPAAEQKPAEEQPPAAEQTPAEEQSPAEKQTSADAEEGQTAEEDSLDDEFDF